MKILIINGPNLNLLGTREPEIYGHDTLEEVAQRCVSTANSRDVELEFLQSNHEGQLVDWIQQANGNTDAIIINAAAYTHTSVAIHDALKPYPGMSLELHISNPHMRESFRHLSYVSSAVDGVIMGLGVDGYTHAINVIIDQLTAQDGE